MEALYFKQFVEFTDKQPDYFSAIQDELGVNPDALKGTPNWAGNISLGNISYNGITYKITRIVKKGNEVSGAMIAPINPKGVFSQRAYLGDKKMRSPDSTPSEGERFIPVDKLNTLMTQGLSQGAVGAGLPGGMGL